MVIKIASLELLTVINRIPLVARYNNIPTLYKKGTPTSCLSRVQAITSAYGGLVLDSIKLGCYKETFRDTLIYSRAGTTATTDSV